MRKGLAKIEGKRMRFRATFDRLGKKTNFKGYREETLLLKCIIEIETGQLVADHLWFSFSKGFESVVWKQGMQLEFEARVKQYKKGHVNKQLGLHLRTQDYKLSHPTKIMVV